MHKNAHLNWYVVALYRTDNNIQVEKNNQYRLQHFQKNIRWVFTPCCYETPKLVLLQPACLKKSHN